MYNIREAAHILGVSMDTLRRWDKKGVLKPVRIAPGSHRKYRKEELCKILPEKDIDASIRYWVNTSEQKASFSRFYDSFHNFDMANKFQNFKEYIEKKFNSFTNSK